ncbi:MAG TPA: hypothetical protein VEF76_11325 [Patescibacteria group bacterium]|nr:hypothetical protein [Patescibacteria group bacterium]
MTTYRRLDENTLLARTDLAEGKEWGGARISRLFNFKARQLTTIYERGGTQEFKIPDGHYSSTPGYAAAVTSSMTVQNFRDLEGSDEIAEMHAKLVDLGGKPPALNEILPQKMDKKLKSGTP